MDPKTEYSEDGTAEDELLHAFFTNARSFDTSTQEEREELQRVVAEGLRGDQAALVVQRITESVVKGTAAARCLTVVPLLQALYNAALNAESEETVSLAAMRALNTIAIMQPDAFHSFSPDLSLLELVRRLEDDVPSTIQFAILSLLTHRVEHTGVDSAEEQTALVETVVNVMEISNDAELHRRALALLALLLKRDALLTHTVHTTRHRVPYLEGTLQAIRSGFLENLAASLSPSDPPELCGEGNCRAASLFRMLQTPESPDATAEIFRRLKLEVEGEDSERLETHPAATWSLLKAILHHGAVREAFVKTKLHPAWCAFLTRQLQLSTSTVAGIEAVRDVVFCLELLAEEPACGSVLLRDASLLPALKGLIVQYGVASLQSSLLTHHVARLGTLLLTHAEDPDSALYPQRASLIQWAQEIEAVATELPKSPSVGDASLRVLFMKSRILQSTLPSPEDATALTAASIKTLNAWHAMDRPPIRTELF